MEELGWGEIRRDGRRLLNFTERVPTLDGVLKTLGQDWDERSPSPHDRGSVNGLHLLSERPMEKAAFVSELGLDPQVAQDVVEYGMSGAYMDEAQSTVYSPLFWQTNADQVSSFLDKHDEPDFAAIAQTTKALRSRPGMPADRLKAPSGLLDSASVSGLLPSVRVRTPRNNHSYFFAPNAQFAGTAESDDLFEKARVIVGALRHGQFHADVTNIKYPRLLLNRFVEGSMAPHSHAVYQYAALKVHGIATISPVRTYSPVRYQVQFIDSPEIRRAADLAPLMLASAGTPALEIVDADLLLMFGQGIIAGASKERTERRRQKVAANDALVRMMRQMRGVKY